MDIKGVIVDSLRLLVMEHSVRIAAQGKTRQELRGPFWRDYRRSVRSPRQWNSDATRELERRGIERADRSWGVLWTARTFR